MKTLQEAIYIVFISSCLIFGPSSAHAIAFSSSQVELDWDSLSYETDDNISIDFGSNFRSSDYNGSISAAINPADFDLDIDYGSASGGSRGTTASVLGGDAKGFSGTSRISSFANAYGPVNASAAVSAAWRSNEFTATGNGSVSFAIKYSIDAVITTSSNGDHGEAFGFAWLSILNSDFDLIDIDQSFIDVHGENGSNEAHSNTGTLYSYFDFSDGFKGSVFAGTFAYADQTSSQSVSEPGSLVLFMMSLPAFFALRRRV